ncbi:hypothetical protein [Mycolicibacter kumamotonensis]|uniref:Uncharacterized protein n=1 Tax=Mycolicibacter kumamotonensis TaxID=354243 RepID=A0A7K3LED9_9MYCO|nr:hypothetical protein [Mycolicibacter kumamotonensis]NDJ90510.1 hypothetical protein [Mycolicibacter kumamotonensis]
MLIADEITELAEEATELAELKASLVFSLVLLQPVPINAIPKTAADTAAARCVALRMCSPFEFGRATQTTRPGHRLSGQMLSGIGPLGNEIGQMNTAIVDEFPRYRRPVYLHGPGPCVVPAGQPGTV